MTALSYIKQKLDETFKVKSYGPDPQMKVFLPRVYTPIGFDWKSYFDEDFTGNLNGLMLRGSDEVHTIFLGSFPHTEVLKKFIERAQPGDLFFTHHPIFMLCGDPRGDFGAGWQPIPKELLDAMKQKRLSFYSCHGPMDYDRALGTRSAMIKTLNAKFEADFFSDGKGCHGAVCTIEETNAAELSERLKTIYEIPYTDMAGVTDKQSIKKVVVIAGGADNLAYMQEAETKGIDAYIAGEIFTRLNTEWGNENNPRMVEFNNRTGMTMIGLSHSGSEFLTMKVQMADWFRQNFTVATELLPQNSWWI